MSNVRASLLRRVLTRKDECNDINWKKVVSIFPKGVDL